MNDEFVPSPARPNPAACLNTFVALFKLRIVALLLFAGTAGAFLAARGFPGWQPLVLMTLTGGLAAMGASALNEYVERASDAQMRRTRKRPLINGAITRANWVPFVALAMIVAPALAVLPFNPALAFFSFAGALIYGGIYTLWLKPRTVLNIVIGGLAGTCAVLSGGAAAGHWSEPGVVVLGLLVFLWTPAHFWSLAMMYREDYARVNVPMLPVRTSMRRSALWVTLHAAATGFAAFAIGIVIAASWLYGLPIVLLTGALLWRCARLIAEPTSARARSLFLTSNAYLALVLLLICLEGVL
ncbi:MAG: protoheme IX farnesyltransferase [Chloroflexi bacterium]|nr:protoheme IX farnesyltransferase [Chloroflexota bacterium]